MSRGRHDNKDECNSILECLFVVEYVPTISIEPKNLRYLIDY